ncbi:GNAT family N-acetyltransferase [Listeria valentina]|uniref:GNAT family N-acetyltransferase n=1 Tax=Listeria valentina TaxID=2705293 RepID=UPI00142FA51D|nr:GNAT family N-acetyltransferase [Listeria valentina]
MHIRALEENDLNHIHELNNKLNVMAYWFEEPYESLSELKSLYQKHIYDESERRFVIIKEGQFAGIIELVEIDYIHRNCEIQVIVKEEFQGEGLAQGAMEKGINYAFQILNLHKVFLYVDTENEGAVHIYKKLGFEIEGTMVEQFYMRGEYKDCYFMGLFKRNWKQAQM